MKHTNGLNTLLNGYRVGTKHPDAVRYQLFKQPKIQATLVRDADGRR